MNKYIITANKIQLDTYDEVDISLNYQIEDILDVASRTTNYSKTVMLPGTNVNNEFFEQIFDVNIDNISFNPNKRIPATVRVTDNEIFNGYLRLVNIYINNKQIDYEVNIIGSLKDILQNFGDYSLRDLNLDRWNHIRNASRITQSWDYNVMINDVLTDTSGDKGQGYVYPYIVNGNNDNIYWDMYVQDLFPAPYIKTIVDSMFEFAGFTYTSQFFESDYFRKLILPYTGDKLELSEQETNLRTVKAGVDAAQPYVQITPTRSRGTDWFYNDASWGYGTYYIGLPRESGEVTDNGSDFEFSDAGGNWTGSKFICQSAGRYNIEMEGKLICKITHDDSKPDIEFKEGQFEYRYQLLLVKAGGGGSILLDSSVDPNDTTDIYGVQLFGLSSGTHASPWYDIDTPLVFAMSAQDVMMEPGDQIIVRFGFRYPSNVKWYGLSDNKHRAALTFKQSYGGGFTKMVIEPASNESFGGEYVNLSQTLPDNFKMKDFFYDLINMFNLIVMDNPDKEGDLIIEPRSNFFNSKKKIKDWNLKLDNDSQVKITPMSELDAKTFLYTYKKDEDWLNAEYEKETGGKIYGQYKVDVINDFSDLTKKTEVSFSPTPNTDMYINGRVAPFFAEKEDEEITPKKVNPRILFYNGTLPTNNLYFYNYTNNLHSIYNVYPYCGMVDHPTSPEHDLSFGMVDKMYWYTSEVTTQTLFEEFHKQTLNSIVDINARLFEGYFHLTPHDIADFDFRDIIFLQGSYWRVNIIKDYNPLGSDSLTNVVLYKIIDFDFVSPYLIEVPVSSQNCPPDIIGVKPNPGSKGGPIYISASGLEMTEDCCRSVGGVWINGVCNAVMSMPFPGGGIATGVGTQTKVPYDSGSRPGTSNPTGPTTTQRNNNSQNTTGVKVAGRGSYVPEGSQAKLIIGDNSTVQKNVTGTVVIGDNINATESGAVYIGNIKIGQDGNITTNGIVIIDGGEDEVFDFDKTNLIDVIDGTYDDVRNPGGDSKARPIIDGGTPN